MATSQPPIASPEIELTRGREETAPGAQDRASLAPRVTVIIVSYNTKGPLLDCLESLETERRTLPLDVIVVDNNSTDETPFAVATSFPWVHLLVNRENVGFARAVNQGLEFSTGDFVLLLNPDTIVPAGSIAASVQELANHPDTGMLGCKLVRPSGDFDHAAKRGFPTIASALYYFLGLSRRYPESPRLSQYTASHLGIDEPGQVDAINGAFMLVRKEALVEVGAMDERYWLWAEDLDWCKRFWDQGWKVLYWPGVEVTHLKGASVGDHRSTRLNFAFHRSIWLFYAKHHAHEHSSLVSAIVWLGLWSKFVASIVGNAVRRRAGGRGERHRHYGPAR